MPRETNIQIRRGSANDWASVNPTLASGEMAIENDTRKVKVGDGTTVWNELRYLGFDGGDLDGGGGGEPSPTATPVPPTATPVPPTATPVPPTATPVPPSGVFNLTAAPGNAVLVNGGTGCYAVREGLWEGQTQYKHITNNAYVFFAPTGGFMSSPIWRLTFVPPESWTYSDTSYEHSGSSLPSDGQGWGSSGATFNSGC